MQAEVEAAIIGGGVVGLGIAVRLASMVGSLALFERHEGWGRETSSRNSEVIHSGMYYPPGSLKARLCVAGRRMLYDFCAKNRVAHQACGKIVVATTDAEIGELERLALRGAENGVEGLRLLARGEVMAREPNVRAVAGLHSPATGILSAHELMAACARLAEDSGALLVTGAEVRGLAKDGSLWEVRYRDSGGEDTVRARAVVNAAGLGAWDVMRMADLDPDAMNLRARLVKGDYFAVKGAKRGMISRLVYPTPRDGLTSLGIHTVVGLSGGFKLGPNAYLVEEIDYTVDESRRRAFFEEVRGYLPFLEEEDLAPDMSGIRPKLSGPGDEVRDFHIAHETAAPGFFSLCGIESPGLTASLAIGDHVALMVREYLS